MAGSIAPNTRVGAILSATATRVEFLGYGVYVGDEVPPKKTPGLLGELADLGITNAKIQLDSGKVVWGAECWWGTEDHVRRTLGNRIVVDVDIDVIRTAQTD